MSTIQGDGCQGSRAATIGDTFHWDGPVCWSPIQLPARVTFWPSPAPKDDGTTHSRSGPAPFKGAHKTRLGNKRQWQRQKTKTKTTAPFKGAHKIKQRNNALLNASGTMKKSKICQIFHSNWHWSSLSLDLTTAEELSYKPIPNHSLMILFDHGSVAFFLVSMVGLSYCHMDAICTMLTFCWSFVHSCVNFGSNHALLSTGGQHSTLEEDLWWGWCQW